MFCLNLVSHDPFFNLSIEEVLLKDREEEYMILYINDPSLIIGKHQSAHREINTKYVTENQIPVIRRISGGGTVFHDSGNLNFSFIIKSEPGKQVDFRLYTGPVIEFLKSTGVDARFEGKNDLKVEGLKISGNAEHIHGNRVLHHGTLLFSTSLDTLRNSMRKDNSCYSSRAVVSNPSSVTNLNERMTRIRNINEFRSEMMNYFLLNFPGNVIYTLSEAEILQARSLAVSKYSTWEWNWAYGPEYTFKNRFEMNNLLHTCTLFIKDGIISECDIEGSNQMKSVSKKLIGCRHMVDDLREVLRAENVFLSEDEIYNFF